MDTASVDRTAGRGPERGADPEVDELLGALEAVADRLPWAEDLETVEARVAPLLDRLASSPGLLARWIRRVADDPELLAHCEYDPVLEKIVLFRDPRRDLRLRLHVFRPGHADRPHNHRWSFVARVLHGGYRHLLFGSDAELDETVTPSALPPLLVQEVGPGSRYSLHHSLVHSLIARPGSASLILRGPAEKERMLVMDRDTDEAWWHYSAGTGDPETVDPTEEHRKHRVMDRDHLLDLLEQLQSGGVL